MIQALLFDFGRVISSQKSPSLFRSYEKDLGLAHDTINTIMFGSRAWQDALVGKLTAEEFWYAIGPELGLDTREEIDDFRRRYYNDESINQDVLSLIKMLNGRFKLAVLSNHPRGLVDWLADWGIRHFFDVVYCSGDEGRAKPDPAVYLTTLARLGVPPYDSVFIDDTAGHVHAAQHLGMHGILFYDADKLEQDLKAIIGSF
jgi:putative hydrolase of the HAD superfamily